MKILRRAGRDSPGTAANKLRAAVLSVGVPVAGRSDTEIALLAARELRAVAEAQHEAIHGVLPSSVRGAWAQH